MKAPPFRYLTPATRDECLSQLSAHGDEAQILAGGQSLMPMLNLRIARPAVLIDINRLTELTGITEECGGIAIGAMTRHADILASELIRGRHGLLTEAGPQIAHAAIRSRGTFGGSLCLADPAAEWPACALALRAEMELASAARGVRRVPADEFFQGLYTTARQPDELLTRILLPAAGGHRVYAFDEISRRQGDFAMAGIALVADAIHPLVSGIRIALLGVSDRPMLAERAMQALEGETLDSSSTSAAAEALRREVNPSDDPACSAAYRRRIAGVLLERILLRLREETRHDI